METINNDIGFHVRYKVFYCESGFSLLQGKDRIICEDTSTTNTAKSRTYPIFDPGLTPPARNLRYVKRNSRTASSRSTATYKTLARNLLVYRARQSPKHRREQTCHEDNEPSSELGAFANITLRPTRAVDLVFQSTHVSTLSVGRIDAHRLRQPSPVLFLFPIPTDALQGGGHFLAGVP